MSYHEAFWLVAGTAAPVIALAAVVALPDVSATQDKAASKRRGPPVDVKVGPPADVKHVKVLVEDPFPQTLSRLSMLGSLANVIVQAGLLAVSLSALAAKRDLTPMWLPIICAVTGILLLAGSLLVVAWIRRPINQAKYQDRMSKRLSRW